MQESYRGIAIVVIVHSMYYMYNQARVNIPAPSARTIQRRIASTHFKTDASIQVIKTPTEEYANYFFS